MDSITAAHARLLRDGSIQFDRPAPAIAIPPPALPPVRPVAGGAAGSWVFWVVLAVVLLGVFASLLRTWPGWVRRKPERAPDVTAPAPLPLPLIALPEADALAGLGRFGEAAHVLLLRGVAAIGERFPRALTPSFTSRDIAGLAVLPVPMRQAFAGIARPVEQAVFARRTLSREEWEACRALYAGLAAPARSP